MHQAFLQRGVILHNPSTITLEISPEQIAQGAQIFPGCRIAGKTTSIGPNCRIGTEGPATIEDCQLGSNVSFASGFAKQATLLDDVSIGANAHIRPGTLLEEQASIAHCVGLKQTMLMPFVTLGSLINFCDCLMAGGTSRSNHSEVGSSFVHFNFTPRQDKATPSLFGDVPNGILLDQAPIFLGGQCGVVGPVRMAFGCVLAAGSVLRKDTLTPNTLLAPDTPTPQTSKCFDPQTYTNIDRVVRNNLIYLGNLHALFVWYNTVRAQWLQATPFTEACLQGALTRIQEMLQERTKQLSRMAERVRQSPTQHTSHTRFLALMGSLDTVPPQTPAPPPEGLQQHIQAQQQKGYLACIQSLPTETKEQARAWLQSIVSNVTDKWEQTTNE